MHSKQTENDKTETKMNGSVGMNGYKKTYAQEKKVSAALVLFARFVLWLTREETVKNIKCTLALACVLAVALLAGAMGVGAVSLLLGGLASFAFGGLGLLLTFDMN